MSGWMTYPDRRATPRGNYKRRRHGNAKHGRYAKQACASRLSVRWLKAMVYGRATPEMIVELPRPAPGWRLYPHLHPLGQ